MGVLSGLIASSGLTPTYLSAAANASPGKLYQCDTSAGAFTVTLPTGTTGSVLRFVDDQGTWGTNALTISPAASETIQGISGSGALVCNISGAYVEFTWDSTNAWWVVQTTGFQYGPPASTTQRGTVYAQKQYVAGTVYANGTPEASSTQGGWARARGVFVPYQTADGAWRMKFNVNGTFTVTPVSTVTVTINGVTFKNSSNFSQAVSAFLLGESSTAMARSYASSGSGNLSLDTTSAINCSGVSFSGDVELDSKPTWAD